MPQDCMILHAAKAKDLDIGFTSPFERRRLGVHTLQRPFDKERVHTGLEQKFAYGRTAFPGNRNTSLLSSSKDNMKSQTLVPRDFL